jgi:hypothetical protein
MGQNAQRHPGGHGGGGDDALGDCDHGALVRHFEKQAKIEVKRRPAG